MSKTKYRWITIISLFAVLFMILGFVIGLPATARAYANTYAPSSIFSAGTGGTVSASEKGEEEDAKAYIEFSFSDGGKVHYRRDLALKWYESKDSVRYFSMAFAFGEINFEKLTIAFESAEENISKEAKATNSVVFEKDADETKIKASVRNADFNEDDDSAALHTVSVDKDKDILLSFDDSTDCEIGEFNVGIKSGDGASEILGKFTNVGGYYMEYRSSSSSTPNTPMTFTAEFPAESASDLRQKMLMKSLNGQSFELNSENRVNDDTPAVLVLNEQIYAFKLGQKFSLSYEAIDVCDDNVTVEREYYMLKQSEGKFIMPNEEKLSGEGKEDYEPYNYKSLTTSTYFLPSAENKDQVEYVAIRFKLKDDTSDNDTYINLSWYAAAGATETKSCEGYKETEQDGNKEITTTTADFDFIKVDRAKTGPYYKFLEANDGDSENRITNEPSFTDAKQAYQAALDEAADYELSKTSAGSGAYIYLPSLRGLIGSDSAGYRNLKFSIYYFKPSQGESATASSQTSLNYNALKLEVTEKGVYRFRVLAQDASGNGMEYYLNGEKVTVSSSNIWDIEEIPEFTFEIDYKGPTIEDGEEQSLGYRNDNYTFSDFEVVALTGYQKEYSLYRYNGNNLPENMSAPSSYADFVENAKDYFEKFTQADNAQADKNNKILYEIGEYQDDVKEDDEAKWNRTDNDYNWDPDSSLSFVPQEAGYYVLRIVVQDKVLPGKTAEAFQVIEVRNPIDTIPGQSQWLQENVVSVVLFAISGVLAIIVVVLFLIKPSEKKVEEIDLEKLKGKKKDKKK